MRRAVRAIVIKDGHLLVMHRKKFGNEYYTLIGGKVEADETDEQALYRELQEETGVKVTNPQLVVVEDAAKRFGVQYVFACDYMSGEPHLAPDSGEALDNARGQNIYLPEWIEIRTLPTLPFRSNELLQQLLVMFAHGYPAQPVRIQSD